MHFQHLGLFEFLVSTRKDEKWTHVEVEKLQAAWQANDSKMMENLVKSNGIKGIPALSHSHGMNIHIDFLLVVDQTAPQIRLLLCNLHLDIVIFCRISPIHSREFL
jgi:hypothetical protein